MKKFSRNSALLAASVTALLSSTVANAAVDLDLGTGSQVFAKEISIESSPTLSPTTIQGTVGFGFSSGANFYVRYDLDNGAKFGTALSLTSLVSSGITGTGTALPTITLAAGGTTADGYAVFNITAGTAGVPSTSLLTLTAPTLKVANRNAVKMRYRLFTDAATAANPPATAISLKDTNASLFKFDTAMSLAVVTSNTTTASVVDNFLKFLGTTPTVATIGSFKLSNSTGALVAAGTAGGATVDLIADLGASKSSLVVSGDFSAAFDSGSTSSSTSALARVWLQTGTTCAASTPTTAAAIGTSSSTTTAGYLLPTAIAADGKSVTFGTLSNSTTLPPSGSVTAVVTAAGVLGTGVTLCYQPNTTSPAIVSDYGISFNPVSTSTNNYSVSPVVGTTFGSIKRNGAELQAPFANVITGYKSRIYLTNTGAQDAPFSMSVQTEPGTSFTPVSPLPAGLTLVNGLISGAIPKTGNMFFILDQVGTFTAASGSTAAASTRGSLIFKIAADCNSIQGMFQLRNQTTGDFDSAPLLRPAGHCN